MPKWPKGEEMDSLIERWKAMSDHYLPDVPDRCTRCGRSSWTGDILIVFAEGGDLQDAEGWKHYYCTPCGYAAIIDSKVPSATMVYAEPEDLGQSLSRLGFEKVTRVREAFQIVDQIHDHMAGLAARVDAAISARVDALVKKGDIPS